MATRKRPTGSSQDDLFNPEVELLLPARLAVDGKVLGSAVRQLDVPAQRARCRLRPFAIRRVNGYETTLESGEILKVISAKTATPLEADLVLLAPGATEPERIVEALELGDGRWLNVLPTNIGTLDRSARAARLEAVTASWIDAVHLREGRAAANEQPARPGLRRPQVGALHAALAHATRSTDPATIVMPTGTGKTETMLALNANQRFDRLLVVVPTDALREQIAGKFETFGVLKQQACLDDTAAFPLVMRLSHIPTSQAEVDEIFDSANVVVTTMQIAGRAEAPVQERMAARASALFIDEAHHIGAPTWARFRGLFVDREPPLPIVQFTATPFREDGRPRRWRVHLHLSAQEGAAGRLFQTDPFRGCFRSGPSRRDPAIADKLGEVLQAIWTPASTILLWRAARRSTRAKDLHQLYCDVSPNTGRSSFTASNRISERREISRSYDASRAGSSSVSICWAKASTFRN